MKLSRTIPGHVKTIEVKWCRRDFTSMTPRYREIRKGARYRGFNCYWCKHEFTDGESIALACVIGTGNRTLCDECAAVCQRDGKEGK